ncbi:MAG: pyridoxamine 5'-phosphate oxidase family protein [Planctomycetota bacterium]
MGKVFDAIDESVAEFIARQKLFFVATAPDGEGHINVSPKGLDSFAVLGPNQVAYLDLTGSGAETIAHLRQNGRITLMFCAFEGLPNIVRLYGSGRAVLRDDPGYGTLAERFGELGGARSIVVVDVTRVSTSCGYGVPLMEFQGERSILDGWAEQKGESGVRAYWAEKNVSSIDGLPAIDLQGESQG